MDVSAGCQLVLFYALYRHDIIEGMLSYLVICTAQNGLRLREGELPAPGHTANK